MSKQSSVAGHVITCVVLASATTVYGDPIEFDFKDPKGVNGMTFVADSLIEPIMGLASGVSGVVVYDPGNPTATTGGIVVEAKTLQTPNKGMTSTLLGADWLQVAEYPEISFEFKRVKEAKGQGKKGMLLTVIGEFTLKGIKKTMQVPVRVVYLKGKAGERSSGATGDLLVLRAEFTINRKHFKIKPEVGPDTVSNEIEIRVAIVGTQSR